MNRMTKKNEYGEYQPVEQGKILFDCLNKLGELENIEEEIGIELATLFKVLKNGCWVIGNHCNYTKNEVYFLRYKNDIDTVDFEKRRFIINEYPAQNEIDMHKLYFKDYGKTWALTKEELQSKGVVPVIHAMWEWYNDETGWIDWKGPACEDKSGWRCSNCKNMLEDTFGHLWDEEDPPKINFCPNCGAKMHKQEDFELI